MLERPDFERLDDLPDVDVAVQRARLRRGDAHPPPAASLVTAPPSPLAKQNALFLVVGFAILIAIGTLLLRLPAAGATRPLTWDEALFTATSAVTVTGLTVVTTATDLSLFGQIVVLVLIELGGVGFITFAVVLFALIGRRIGVTQRLLLQQSLGVLHSVRITRVALIVLGVTLLIQAVGALLLWLRWWPALGAGRAAYLAIFHAVSAFCNAGFDLFGGTGTVLFGFGRDPFTLLILMTLIVIGGLGIVAVTDLVTYPWDRRLMVYTKLTLLVFGIFTALGLGILLIDDVFDGTALAEMPPGERLLVATFVAVVRTSGFTIVPIQELSYASQLTLMAMMFVGGAPASMASGVTTSTVGVIMVAVMATVRGMPQAVIFERVLPFETIAKAAAIMTISTLLCFGLTLVLLTGRPNVPFFAIFEAISAFSNSGYSVGAIEDVNLPGRLIMALTMFWGRLGPLTLVVLLAQREQPMLARYPAEPIIIG